ncbi:hypothetical protein HDU93_006512 [Gonapodya sp. JEL0774]|nr:hypothetical protein HDU93_006512 [Gonapodya sp. JEL0774]
MSPPRYESVFKDDLFAGKTVLGKLHTTLKFNEYRSIAKSREVELALADKIAAAGYKGLCDVIQLDVRDHKQCKKVVEEIVHRWGRLDALVNNAGGQFPSPAEKISPNGWRSVIDLNLTGTFLMSQAAYLGWMKDNGGSIVNIIVDMWNGAAARAGVYNLTRTLAQEWTPHSGVRINCVAPGAIIGAGQTNYPKSVQKVVKERFSWQNPSGRLGTESEVSSAVVFLLTPGASYINGTSLNVDGGQSIRQGPIFEDTVFSPDSKLPIYNGFGLTLDDDQRRQLGSDSPFVELFEKMAAIKSLEQRKRETKL